MQGLDRVLVEDARDSDVQLGLRGSTTAVVGCFLTASTPSFRDPLPPTASVPM